MLRLLLAALATFCLEECLFADVVAPEAVLLTPARGALLLLTILEVELLLGLLFSFILGMGTEETAATCTSSRNFLKSLSAIFLPEDDDIWGVCCSSFIFSFVCRFFSGVAVAETLLGVGGFAFSLC